MTTDPKFEAALAIHRFGMGPTSGSIAAIADDPRRALLDELERPGAGQVAKGNLPDSAAASRAWSDFLGGQVAQQKLARRVREQTGAPGMAAGATDNGAVNVSAEASPSAPDSAGRQGQQPNVAVELMQNEAKARIEAAVSAQIGFVERLVWFWSNHFCVSTEIVMFMAGAYEREAIRPHVLGRFADMLLAAETHPAMLSYLDNVDSIGPNSVAGIIRNRGLNENLAREALELHTLGVRSGYTQADVTNFANVITGWTAIFPSVPKYGGEFIFDAREHEPGDQVILGKRYSDTGVEQGRAVLADLARHPATARHIAEKLARHFVADEPPPSLVDKLAKSFSDSDGDLKEVARTLVLAEESWTPKRTKLKRPCEWHVAALRLAGAHGRAIRFMTGQALLGEPLWGPLAPNGFSDYQATWIDGLPQRADIASDFADRVADRVDPATLVEQALGPLASAETRNAVARAGSRAQALALLLMAPEFLRS
jgi:uncharacterized protein (DUF1800 family)